MMEVIEKALRSVWRFALFVIASILFLPALLIVTHLEKPWTTLLGELFDL